MRAASTTPAAASFRTEVVSRLSKHDKPRTPGEPQQQQKIDPHAGRRREREADLRQASHQRDLERDVDDDRNE